MARVTERERKYMARLKARAEILRARLPSGGTAAQDALAELRALEWVLEFLDGQILNGEWVP
ncbi:MAG TPA: hypothetical protein VI229_00205 [Burkholderiales bacterium]